MENKLYIYIDESGDRGLPEHKSPSRFFVLSFLFIPDDKKDNINNQILTTILKLKIYNEIKFVKTSYKHKEKFFTEIAKINFNAEVFVFNKKRLKTFIYYFLKSIKLLKIDHKYNELSIVIDGIDKNIFSVKDIKEIKNQFDVKSRISFIDSKDSFLIQLADMIAGLVHAINRGKVDYVSILKKLGNKIKITHME